MLILAVLILFGVAAVCFLHQGNGPAEGIVPAALDVTGTSVMVAGDVEGFSASDTVVAGIPVRFPEQDPGALGACLITISPVTGTWGRYDMDQARVTWSSGNGTMTLPFLAAGPVDRPGWAIVSRSHLIPYHAADEDRILEPGELFGLLVIAPEPRGPYGQFTVEIVPGRASPPLAVRRTVPARVTPVMDLDA